MDRTTFDIHLGTLEEQAARTTQRFAFSRSALFPCLGDDTGQTPFDHHYIYHTGWAARRLRALSPCRHVDFGSSLYFVAIASAICPFEFYDYRPAPLDLVGVKTGYANLHGLPFSANSLESVSCMHVIEHVGLGRYGDPIDYDGDLKAIFELTRVVALDGSLLFVVPIGRPRLLFNAHRIYAYNYLLQLFSQRFALVEFTLVTDGGSLVTNATREQADAQWYGCGCFHFRKTG